MLTALRLFCYWLLRQVLSLRYRVRVTGLEKVRDLPGPVLVLPNHPAFVDPLIVFSQLWRYLHVRPMVYEDNFKNLLLRPFISFIDAVPVPDMEKASQEARGRAGEAVANVIAGLRGGRNHILWPAGRLQRGGGVEVIGGARALTEILKEVPQATLIAVRTRGLWGSSFSWAQTGNAPSLVGTLLAGAGWLLANLLFFMPRRAVHLTVEVIDRSQLPHLRREEINPWFERWYNTGGPETPTWVPYHFLFGRRSFDFPKPQGAADADLARVAPETRREVNQLVAELLRRPLTPEEDAAGTTLDRLGLDSIERMDLNLKIESHFGFTADQVPTTLGQLWLLAQGLARKGTVKPPPPLWFQPPGDDRPPEILGATVAEAFLNRALANPGDPCVGDDLAGVLTYRRLLIGAAALAPALRQLPGDNLGLLLPASVGSDVAFLAMHLAGKLPVVLNWTTGPGNLAHAAKVMNLQHVVTSKAFINRTGIQVAGVEYLFLEELRKRLGRLGLLRAWSAAHLWPNSLRLASVDPDRPAVVLFTSGSEKAPKAVPLTHRNILSNHRSMLQALELTRRDSLLAFLPAFHSFGLSVTGLLPILAGFRAVRHPDPTDAAGLLRKVEAYRTTLLVGTPTFVGYILDRAKPGQLESLRLIIVGAEKAPESLFERVRTLAPRAAVLEGYGITECSPVVSVNLPTGGKPGSIGRPLPGVELAVVDPNTGDPLANGQLGMLLVAGPTVFPGYVGHDGPPPFRELNGKRWYVTGDLATVDPDSFIHFGGRLKRFLKAGGEMVSLPALEEPFVKRYPPTKEGPRVAVEGVETETGRRVRLVLFTTEPLTLSQANAMLEEAGFTGVLRLDEVRQVPSIPVLGTGKTDYKVLRAMLAKVAESQVASRER